MLVLGIDPGEIHCGIAIVETRDDDCGSHATTRTIDALEMTPELLFLNLDYWCSSRRFGKIVLESFQLYPDKAAAQSFSTFETVETIGVVKYIVKRRNALHLLHMQMPTIKKPARAMMMRLGVPALRGNQHMKDAEMHAWYWLIQQGYVNLTNPFESREV